MLVICCCIEYRKYSFYLNYMFSILQKKFPNLVFIIIQKYWRILKGNARPEVKKALLALERPTCKAIQVEYVNA